MAFVLAEHYAFFVLAANERRILTISAVINNDASDPLKVLRYIELKSGYSDNGPAWIAYVETSKTHRTLYFNGRGLMKLKGQRRGESGGNYIDMESGQSYWVSGVKMNGEDRHWAGSGKVMVEAAAVPEYLKTVKAGTLDTSRYTVTNSIRQTDIVRLSRVANAAGKGWPGDLEEQTPYSFRRNVTSSQE
jgi:hypothetical protein